MTVDITTMQAELRDMSLPGGEIVIEPYESALADTALRAGFVTEGSAHPVWYVIASLRCMGVSVEELCRLAHHGEGDSLLLGNCRVEQFHDLRTGDTYAASARIGDVSSRTTRDGMRLDSVEVTVELRSTGETVPGGTMGSVVSTYLFKRAAL